MNETWRALSREAASAAEHVAIGATALSKANYTRPGTYSEALFALSVGFERASKLALVVDHALDNNGRFPASSLARRYSHRLRDLLERADAIAASRGITDAVYRLPRSEIHDGVVHVLSDFASNVTRYYNLSVVCADREAAATDDPISSWFENVTLRVLEHHYRPKSKALDAQRARAVAKLLEPFSMVRFEAETGEAIESLYDASLRTAQTERATPYTRMYVLQIARFLGNLLTVLGHAGYSLAEPLIPDFGEFFAIFHNSDRYFRVRKTWSIYRR